MAINTKNKLKHLNHISDLLETIIKSVRDLEDNITNTLTDIENNCVDIQKEMNDLEDYISDCEDDAEHWEYEYNELYEK